jgi:uncharacterized protein involved in propanediol utilization
VIQGQLDVERSGMSLLTFPVRLISRNTLADEHIRRSNGRGSKAVENFSNRRNGPLEIESQGFCAVPLLDAAVLRAA